MIKAIAITTVWRRSFHGLLGGSRVRGSNPLYTPAPMMRCVAACLLLTSTADAAGDDACPCVASPAWQAGATDSATGRLKNVVGSETTYYPATYGIGACAAHSAGDGTPASGSASCIDSTGAAHGSRPAWCADAWCYVDQNNCEIAGGAIASSLFPDAHYSYQTCSDGSSTSSLGEDGDALSLEELRVVVEDYLYANAAAVETAYAATAASTDACDFSKSCPCAGCEHDVDWHCTSGGQVDLESAVLFERNEGYTTDTPDAKQMQCMASAVNGEFLRVAGKEHVEHPERIGYQMFGGQTTGAMANWPAVEWCSADYDPRFRPWYSSAASGPKDVVMVIDISGSSRQHKHPPDRGLLLFTAAHLPQFIMYYQGDF